VSDPLVIAGRELRSRLITGTGKYPSLEVMRDAVVASGCELVTVAVRRIDLDEVGEAITDWLPDGVGLLPPTAGRFPGATPVHVALDRRLGRRLLLDEEGTERLVLTLEREPGGEEEALVGLCS